ncbi:MAG: T9SS type A sorting domain-containing protein [Candidatus Zixiibacteriota bacterium]|jgi:hypothetical protein
MDLKKVIAAALVLKAAFVFAGEWTIEIPDGTGDAGWCISLVLGEGDKPHISYNYGFVGGDDLMYAYKEGGTWHTEVADDAAAYSGRDTSICVDANGRPRIAVALQSGSPGIRFAEKNGSQWNTTTVDSGVKVRRVALVTDSNGRYHILYDDRDTFHLKYAYYDGSSWNVTTVDTTPTGWISAVDVAIDAADHLHVIYDVDGDVKYGYYDGASWQLAFIENSILCGSLSIAVGPDDKPHAVYYEENADYVKYAYYDSGQWNIENVVSQIPDAAPAVAIAVDAGGEAHIAYAKWNSISDKDLIYAHRDNGTWQFTTVDDEGDLGLSLDIALDHWGFPHVAYHRCTGSLGELKYAWYYDDNAIELAGFTASGASESAIDLSWRARATAGERIAGFDLYRRRAGAAGVSSDSWTKVNSSLIVGENPYSYRDAALEAATGYEYRLEAIVANEAEALGTASGATLGAARPFALRAAYPNPTTGAVTFSFALAGATDAELAVFDLAGRRVATPLCGPLAAGDHDVSTALDLAPGVYLYRLEAAGFSATRRLAVVE